MGNQICVCCCFTPLEKQPPSQNTISLFDVQCGECLKWRLISYEDEYEEIMSKSTEEPFTCNKKPNLTCDADISMTPPGLGCLRSRTSQSLVLRRDFSKLDVYYVTPTVKKLRSGTEVAKYLNENQEIKGVKVDEFSFAIPKIVEETIPKHTGRKTPNSEKCAKDNASQ